MVPAQNSSKKQLFKTNISKKNSPAKKYIRKKSISIENSSFLDKHKFFQTSAVMYN